MIITLTLAALALLGLWRVVRGAFGRRGPSWVVRELRSPGGFVYTVRDAPGQERQILHARSRQWVPESECQFSSLPFFEQWHRDDYRAAVGSGQIGRVE